ncbi:MAG: universal stress protein [Hyphomicrobiales bacterium]
MRSILAVAELSPSLPTQIKAAAAFARLFGGHVSVVAPRADFRSVLVGAGGIGAVAPIPYEDFEGSEESRLDEIKAASEAAMRDAGLPLREGSSMQTEPTGSWVSLAEPGDSAVGRLARAYDISVLPRPEAGQQVPRRELLEAVLFDSGRPLLMVPPRAVSTLGDTIVVAWNGSTESARSVSFAMPLLARAQRVVVLTVEGGMVEGPGANELCRALRLNGIQAEPVHIEGTSKPPGAMITDYAASIGCDLLVKGAYTHSRLRQLIFGGATDLILTSADVPVLFAH